ncbi:hypothetical protein [Brevundimonas sp. R86498]|uniref:hypothetical protein n=1 Tax=Brevundimonas sp. R86498 TaxID=3093845 RepID=UPI0037CBBD9B
MRLKIIQIVAILGSAIAFVLAFMAAGALLASLVFALIGAALLGWVVYGLSRAAFARPSPANALSHERHRPVRPPSA